MARVSQAPGLGQVPVRELGRELAQVVHRAPPAEAVSRDLVQGVALTGN